MAISPKKAAEKNLKNLEKKLTETINYIDERLAKEYYGAGTVIVTIDGRLRQRIINEIVGRYERVGWIVHQHSGSSRNESYHTFRFTAKTEPKTGERRNIQLEIERG